MAEGQEEANYMPIGAIRESQFGTMKVVQFPSLCRSAEVVWR